MDIKKDNEMYMQIAMLTAKEVIREDFRSDASSSRITPSSHLDGTECLPVTIIVVRMRLTASSLQSRKFSMQNLTPLQSSAKMVTPQ